MVKPLEDEPLRASLLDRLDGLSRVGRFAGRQTLDEFVASIHTNLQNLLNTRWRVSQWPPGLDELDDSLVNFGIPDFTGANMSSPGDRQLFCEIVEKMILLHDRRIMDVRVVFQDTADSADRNLRFRIEVEVRASPDPAEVTFDSQIDPMSHKIRIALNH
ncbi:MAG: type VI secretion system baseplate subunit TssE [Pirellulaceae bacterium]|nr:type VI secretion system baseplate subunit TssE [Pirellulaceae bacterium]